MNIPHKIIQIATQAETLDVNSGFYVLTEVGTIYVCVVKPSGTEYCWRSVSLELEVDENPNQLSFSF